MAGEVHDGEDGSPQAAGREADSRVAFTISEAVMGDAVNAPGLWKRVTQISKEILRPIRDALIASGMKVSEPATGKPWGSGFIVGEGASRVNLFLFPYIDEDRKCWVGDIRISEVWPWWTILTMGYKATPLQLEMIGRVAAILKPQLESNPGFTEIDWNPPEKDEH